jgi:sulfur-oxidizing protein SoxY
MRTGRRLFIGGILAFTALAMVWPKIAFGSTEAGEALIELLGTDQTTPSDEISMVLPVIAENGAEVPVMVKTSLTGVKSINIVVERNPRPLAISFEFSPHMLPEVSCRIKMAETSRVMAVVVTGSGIFSTSREVTVTLGGCA